jgi:hypothetical protein
MGKAMKDTKQYTGDLHVNEADGERALPSATSLGAYRLLINE